MDIALLPSFGLRPGPPPRQQHLTARHLVGIGMFGLLGFVITAVIVSGPDGTTAVDLLIYRAVQAHRVAAGVQVATIVTALGSYQWVIVLTAAFAAIALLQARRLVEPLVLLMSAPFASSLAYLIKIAVGRTRPPSALTMGEAPTDYSFPSGHTTSGTVVFLLGALIISSFIDRARWRWTIRALGVLIAICIGISRVYLGYHWTTDVIGGWLLATTIVATALLIVAAVNSTRSTRPMEVGTPPEEVVHVRHPPRGASIVLVTTVATMVLTACGLPATPRPTIPSGAARSTPTPTAPTTTAPHTTAPTTTAPPASPSDPATGEPSTGPRVLLDESFDSPQLDDSIWSTCYWWNQDGCTITTNNELEWYRPEGVQLSGGAVQLVAERGDQHASDGNTYPFRSGMISTGPPSENKPAKLAFTYGTVEARLRVPAGKGLWAAMWLLPADLNSRPEIDVLEILGNDPRASIMHLHPKDRGATSPSRTVSMPGVDYSRSWHDFRLDWHPGTLTYVIDGHQVWRLTGRQVPSQPMYLIFNLAVGGAYPGDPDDSTRFPARMSIDHVKITAAQ